MSILCNNTNKSLCAQNGISNLQALFNNSVVANLAVSSAVFGVESSNYSASVPQQAVTAHLLASLAQSSREHLP